ncbi:MULTISPECIES: helix-turn-helix domain-containing protein [unclassified Streptomyces]|uniref:helix-turn-helix domain-containing protein n=1 Tax=unclassified Streptomyces TaxID=2593676 RepID=UPI001660B997|nr:MULTISPECIES: helix-turn-helix transcriptional regulator [unclassified Streptomyces]MBD0710879.1 transcriptional regulator [Streptomyces sp. CBMA291]MBD0717844.1 transcriptional regulator [Streptomyces sp. CBMA370]
MSDSARSGAPWEEFGRGLRSWRRRSGLTQRQLGLIVGYHHSQISRLEAGLREPPPGLVHRLDAVLGAGGELASLAAASHGPGGGAPHEPRRIPLDQGLFTTPPGDEADDARAVWDGLPWPAALPAEGLVCPLHDNAGCTTPDRAAAPELLARLTAAAPGHDELTAMEPEVLHALTGFLACVIRGALHLSALDGTAATERLLRGVVRWADSVHTTGRTPYGQLRIAAQYAQVAGRLRMRRGQSAVGMAWFGHGLRWADAVHDLPARATLLSDICALVRLDDDPGPTLGYAEAIGAVDTRRRWIATLSHLYQARGYALRRDGVECRRHISSARRAFARLGRDDGLEAPWLTGAEGEMRVESAIGGALRDLAAATGDRATARRAVEAVARSRAQLSPLMRDTHLLLTLRLADGWACAGDPEAAVALASPVLDEAAGTDELLVRAELDGLHARLGRDWGAVSQVVDYQDQLVDLGVRGAGRGLPEFASRAQRLRTR